MSETQSPYFKPMTEADIIKFPPEVLARFIIQHAAPLLASLDRILQRLQWEMESERINRRQYEIAKRMTELSNEADVNARLTWRELAQEWTENNQRLMMLNQPRNL